MSSQVGKMPIEPLYFRSVFPDVFKIQPKESKTNTSEHINVSAHMVKQKLDPKMIEEKLNEIESLMKRTESHESLQTIKSSPKTDSLLNAFEELKGIQEEQACKRTYSILS